MAEALDDGDTCPAALVVQCGRPLCSDEVSIETHRACARCVGSLGMQRTCAEIRHGGDCNYNRFAWRLHALLIVGGLCLLGRASVKARPFSFRDDCMFSLPVVRKHAVFRHAAVGCL